MRDREQQQLQQSSSSIADTALLMSVAHNTVQNNRAEHSRAWVSLMPAAALSRLCYLKT